MKRMPLKALLVVAVLAALAPGSAAWAADEPPAATPEEAPAARAEAVQDAPAADDLESLARELGLGPEERMSTVQGTPGCGEPMPFCDDDPCCRTPVCFCNGLTGQCQWGCGHCVC